ARRLASHPRDQLADLFDQDKAAFGEERDVVKVGMDPQGHLYARGATIALRHGLLAALAAGAIAPVGTLIGRAAEVQPALPFAQQAQGQPFGDQFLANPPGTRKKEALGAAAAQFAIERRQQLLMPQQAGQRHRRSISSSTSRATSAKTSSRERSV